MNITSDSDGPVLEIDDEKIKIEPDKNGKIAFDRHCKCGKYEPYYFEEEILSEGFQAISCLPGRTQKTLKHDCPYRHELKE